MFSGGERNETFHRDKCLGAVSKLLETGLTLALRGEVLSMDPVLQRALGGAAGRGGKGCGAAGWDSRRLPRMRRRRWFPRRRCMSAPVASSPVSPAPMSATGSVLGQPSEPVRGGKASARQLRKRGHGSFHGRWQEAGLLYSIRPGPVRTAVAAYGCGSGKEQLALAACCSIVRACSVLQLVCAGVRLTECMLMFA